MRRKYCHSLGLRETGMIHEILIGPATDDPYAEDRVRRMLRFARSADRECGTIGDTLSRVISSPAQRMEIWPSASSVVQMLTSGVEAHMSALDAANTNCRARATGTLSKYLINKSEFRPGYASKIPWGLSL